MAWSDEARAAALAARRAKVKSGTAKRTGLRTSGRRLSALKSAGLSGHTQQKARASAARKVAGTPTGKQLSVHAPAKRVAGNTPLSAARGAYQAGIATAKSMKGAKMNRYAPQNVGGIRGGGVGRKRK